MANIDTHFLCSTGDGTNIQCFLNTDDGITIYVSNKDESEDLVVFLDKSTAIKLAKTLRTEINKIGKGNNNG